MPAKIAFLDIETAPNEGYFWGLWQQNIGLPFLKRPTFMLCWSTKWLGKKKVTYRGLEGVGKVEPRHEVLLLPKLWDILDEADIVVGHNVANFDIKHINAAFLRAGMPPPSPYRVVDTLTAVKAAFRFQSNKLEFLVKTLGLEQKLENDGIKLWLDCLAGKKGAWRTMKGYNVNDTAILEEFYLLIRPWIRNHPNLALYEGDDEHVCGTCGSTDLRNKGYYYTNLSKFTRHVCNNCGASKRGRTNLASRDNLLVNAL